MARLRRVRAGVAVAAAVAATVALAAAAGAQGAGGARVYRIDPAQSRLSVSVLRRGALSPFLHDHLFVPEQWSALATLDPAHPETARVELRVAAASLKDQEQALSPSDRAKVEETMRGPQVLDVARYPEIRFTADRFEPGPGSEAANNLKGTLVGTLSLHGQEHPLRVPVEAQIANGSLRAQGTIAFLQSAFGIKPYSTAAGTIAVKDQVEVAFKLAGTQQ